MKKILSYILISLIISANLLAPISVGFNKNNLEIQDSKAEAEWTGCNTLDDYKSAFSASTFSVNGIIVDGETSIASVDFHIKLDTGFETDPSSMYGCTDWDGSYRHFNENDFIILFKENSTGNTGYFNITKSLLLAHNMDKRTSSDMIVSLEEDETIGTTASPIQPLNGLEKFKANLDYTASLYYRAYASRVDTKTPVPAYNAGLDILNDDGDYFMINNQINFSIPSEQSGFSGSVGTGNVIVTPNKSSTLPGCDGFLNPASSDTFMGCVIQAFYYVLFVPTSYLFALAGTMFDYTFNYSVQDKSYSSAFVVQGWGIIRDFCNMFFIFIMLYVAIGTILNLHSMKTKETIVNLVIIGLFINFSLFATQVIIDASNITARVFYNSNTIKITEKGANGVAKLTPGLDIGADGVIPLSAAIVNKVNPQNLIMSATKVNSIPNNSTSGVQGVDTESLGVGQFILVIIMASAVNIVGFIVFITVAFLFIARVIGLWLAMILSPLAFFTYILPEMAGTKMIGWKNWWPETLEIAFLAPIFIFFIYIILKFLQADLITDIVGKSISEDGLGYFVAILIPFAFIMILLLKAKKIAIDMSGEFGEMAVKAGSAIGGMALGGAVGAGAYAMRGTIGKMGNVLAESKFAKTNGRFGRMLGDVGKWTGSKSFDVRSTKLGGDAMKGMGVDAGKAKEGGYAKHKADVQKRREERAKSLEVGHDEHEMHDLHEKEEALQRLKDKNAPELETLEGKIASTQMDATDKSRQAINAEAIANQPGATTAQITTARALRQDAKRLDEEVMELKNQKNAINRATEYRDKDGNLVKDYSDRKEMVNISSSMVQKTEEDAQKKEAVAQAAINNITTVTAAANAQSTAEINQAQITATTSITQAQTNAVAEITRAQADALAANQAKTAAFNNSMMNPQDQNAKNAYEQAVVAYNNAQANVVTATTNANNSVIQAQTEATTKVAEATTKANNTMNQTITDATQSAATKTTAAATARTTANTLKTAHNSGQKVARSKNELDFEDVPDAKFTISKENSARKNEYANEIQGRWFNQNANAHAAHNIRMNAEIKADVKGH